MHHSTVKSFRLATPTDTDGFFFDLGSFYEQAELVADPRDPRVLAVLEHGASLLVAHQVLKIVGVQPHGAELDHAEFSAA